MFAGLLNRTLVSLLKSFHVGLQRGALHLSRICQGPGSPIACLCQNDTLVQKFKVFLVRLQAMGVAPRN